MSTTEQYWGYHLILDAKACYKDLIKDAANISAFARTLVRRIDMVAYGEPQVVYFGKDDKTGYTLVQLIETSNICAHFCDDTGDAYFDVFSCKPFDNNVVKSTVMEFFSPEKLRTTYITRQA